MKRAKTGVKRNRNKARGGEQKHDKSTNGEKKPWRVQKETERESEHKAGEWKPIEHFECHYLGSVPEMRLYGVYCFS